MENAPVVVVCVIPDVELVSGMYYCWEARARLGLHT